MLRLTMCFAGDRFKGVAFRKVADIINGYPEKISSGKQVANVKGVGKGSIAKVTLDLSYLMILCLSSSRGCSYFTKFVQCKADLSFDDFSLTS